MQKKIYYLSTCDTCSRIMKELGIGGKNDASGFEKQDIKKEAITEAQIDEMGKLAGSFEALFSRRSRKYKAMGLADQDLGEQDYRKLILEEYTFLKRPVFLIDGKIFIGNSPKTVAAVKEIL